MTSADQVDFIIVGKTGWIGQHLADLISGLGMVSKFADFRLEDREAILRELDEVKPTYGVLNCAGVTGRPNVDWCEEHKLETIRANVIGVLNLVDVCSLRGMHVTNFATGCIYQYDEEHPIGGKTFTEECPPNFSGSYYSETKAMVEKLIKQYDNVLQLRLRMPVSDDLHHRNFVTKITKYEFVVNVPNCMTVLTELLPVSIDMTMRKVTGVFNFTNPGAISHNEVLALYKEHVDPSFTWKNFSLEEQEKVLKAGRSNCELDASKLLAANPGTTIREVHEAMKLAFQRMAAKGVSHATPLGSSTNKEIAGPAKKQAKIVA